MSKTDPPFGPHAGRKMMETLFLSNWYHEKQGDKLSNPATMSVGDGRDEVSAEQGEMERKRKEIREREAKMRGRGRGQPSYKRRRIRGGGSMPVGRKEDPEMSVREELPNCPYAALTRRQVAQRGDADSPFGIHWRR